MKPYEMTTLDYFIMASPVILMVLSAIVCGIVALWEAWYYRD